MDDTKEVELRAEKQLTRRYWRLLGGISDSISRVVTAKVVAATLAVRLCWRLDVAVPVLCWIFCQQAVIDNAAMPTREYHRRVPPKEKAARVVPRVSAFGGYMDDNVTSCLLRIVTKNIASTLDDTRRKQESGTFCWGSRTTSSARGLSTPPTCFPSYLGEVPATGLLAVIWICRE